MTASIPSPQVASPNLSNFNELFEAVVIDEDMSNNYNNQSLTDSVILAPHRLSPESDGKVNGL